MSRWTFLAFVTLAGCAMFPRSDDAPGTAGADIATGTVVEPKSGSRLRALAWKRGTDVVATGTFRDTKLDTYCQFGATKDGTRCLPLGGNSPSAYANAYPLFLDSACTSPGVAASRFDGTELHPRFARVTELATTTCGSYTSVVALGPAIGQRDAWIKAGDRCVAWKVPNEYDDARSFTPVANTDLVLGTEDRATVTADLAAGRVRGEDGSVAPNALFDTRRDAMCWPDASGHCLPGFPAHAVPNQFADTACSEPAAYFARSWGLGTDPCRPRVVSAYAACSTTITFFEVGAKIDRWYQSATSVRARRMRAGRREARVHERRVQRGRQVRSRARRRVHEERRVSRRSLLPGQMPEAPVFVVFEQRRRDRRR